MIIIFRFSSYFDEIFRMVPSNKMLGSFFSGPTMVKMNRQWQDSHLNTQMRTQTGEKAHKCELCSESFSQLGNLKQHLLIHTGEKPYQCGVCKKSFARPSNLSEHMRNRTDEESYEIELQSAWWSQNNIYWCILASIAASVSKWEFIWSTRRFDQWHKDLKQRKKPHQCTVRVQSFAQISKLPHEYSHCWEATLMWAVCKSCHCSVLGVCMGQPACDCGHL